MALEVLGFGGQVDQFGTSDFSDWSQDYIHFYWLIDQDPRRILRKTNRILPHKPNLQNPQLKTVLPVLERHPLLLPKSLANRLLAHHHPTPKTNNPPFNVHVNRFQHLYHAILAITQQPLAL